MFWFTPFKDKAELASANLFGTNVPPPLVTTVKLFGPTSTALPLNGKSKTSDELNGVASGAAIITCGVLV